MPGAIEVLTFIKCVLTHLVNVFFCTLSYSSVHDKGKIQLK